MISLGYGDFEIVASGPSWAAANVRSYQPGVAVVDPWVSGGPANTKYYHTDHLGTTRTMSVAAGFDGGTRVYTAFGEVVAGPTDRFGYVGAHGYQTHDDLPFLHVGARYYDPGSGRFLQRDPVGIRGGMNTYGYVENEPLTSVDPDGERKVVQHLWQMEEEKKRRERENFVGPPAPEPPVLQPPGRGSTLEDEAKTANNRYVFWKSTFAGLTVFAAATPGGQIIACGLGAGLVIMEGIEGWQ